MKCPVCGGDAIASGLGTICCRGVCFRTVQIGGATSVQVTAPAPKEPVASCAVHRHFAADVVVHSLAADHGEPVSGYAVNVTLKCTDCGDRMRFGGLPSGDSAAGPRVSPDGYELRVPVLNDYIKLPPITAEDIARGDAIEAAEKGYP